MIYSGIVMCEKQKCAFLMHASDPDDAIHMLSQWPSMKDKNIRLLKLSTNIYPNFDNCDVQDLNESGMVGIWMPLS